MAEIYSNKSNFLVLKLNAEEATKLHFGIETGGKYNICICGTCNEDCKPSEIYYVCGINEILCKDCLDDYIDNMVHYNDDDSLLYEIKHFNFVAEKVGMTERASIVGNGKYIIT